MTPTLSSSDIRRIQDLLDRLDPQTAACAVPGCLHAHQTYPAPDEAPALAA